MCQRTAASTPRPAALPRTARAARLLQQRQLRPLLPYPHRRTSGSRGAAARRQRCWAGAAGRVAGRPAGRGGREHHTLEPFPRPCPQVCVPPTQPCRRPTTSHLQLPGCCQHPLTARTCLSSAELLRSSFSGACMSSSPPSPPQMPPPHPCCASSGKHAGTLLRAPLPPARCLGLTPRLRACTSVWRLPCLLIHPLLSLPGGAVAAAASRENEDVNRLRRGLSQAFYFDSFDLAQAVTPAGILCKAGAVCAVCAL